MLRQGLNIAASEAAAEPRRVRLERPSLRRAQEFLNAVARSRALHDPWVSPPATRDALERYVRSLKQGNRVGFFLHETASNELAGIINISEIVRGCFQSGYLGYYAFSPHDGKGLMSDGLSQVLELAFGPLSLHRLEANIQPGNDASIRLVERLGFCKEGESKRYLMIGGTWRDHYRYAIVAEDWERLNA